MNQLTGVENGLPVLEPYDTRLPTWDYAGLMARQCPICGSDGLPRYARQDRLKVNSCAVCGTYFISPAPNEQHLDEFYSRYYRDYHPRVFSAPAALARSILRANPMDTIHVRELASNLELRGKRVLDVGFGPGQHLYHLQRLGAQVHGIDLDPDAVAFVRERLGIDTVRQLNFFDLDMSERYDLILLHDLIEHPLRPLDILRRARELLHPGGLMSIWTPNASFAGIDAQPIAFRCDFEHMQYLTFDSCLYLAAQLKMSIVHMESLGFQNPLEFQVDTLLQDRHRSARRQVLEALAKVPGVMAANRIRHRLSDGWKPCRRCHERNGRHHLFCIFRAR